jgi:uncharacterized protein (DUF1015 family)
MNAKRGLKNVEKSQSYARKSVFDHIFLTYETKMLLNHFANEKTNSLQKTTIFFENAKVRNFFFELRPPSWTSAAIFNLTKNSSKS